MSEERKHDLAAIALLLLVTCAIFADVIAGTSVFFFRDFSRYYFPVKHVQRETVLSGEFPWWTRAYGGGQPMAANPEHETFYPLNWLTLLPDYVGALHWQALLHLAIALAGMYAFLRSLRMRPFASFIGALSFGLGGPMLSKINMSPFLYSMAWVPVTCLFARRFILEGTRRTFALAALFLGVQLLIGEPTTVLQTIALIGGYSLWRAYETRAAQPVGRAIAVGVCAAVLAAVQIVPGIDFVRDAARSRPFEFEVVGQWSFPWARLVELAFPNAFGHHFINETTVFWGTRFYETTSIPFLLSVYPGLLITVLAISGLLARRAGAGVVAAISLVSLIVAAGQHTPLLRLAYDLGIVRTLRYPEKFIVVAIFAMTVFAAKCLDDLAEDTRLRRFAIATTASVGTVALALFAWSFSDSYAATFSRLFETDAQATVFAVGLSRTDWMVATILALVLLVLVKTAAARPPHSRLMWVLVASAVMIFDLARLSPEVTPRLPRSLYDKPEVPSVLWDPSYRLFHQAEFAPRRDEPSAPRPRIHGIRFRDVAAIQYGYRNALFPHFSAAWGLPTVMEPDVDATNLRATIDFRRAVELAAGSRGDRAIEAAMAMSNARFRAVLRTPPATNDITRVQPAVFIESARQPRYYFAGQVETIRDTRDFASKIGAPGYVPSVAFVELPLRAAGTGRVTGVQETANSAVIDVEASGDALLVMSITPHRYWNVAIDGVRASAIPVNVGFQGVVVPSGRHRVTMRYRNPVVIGSAVVSASMLLILGWFYVTERTPKRAS